MYIYEPQQGIYTTRWWLCNWRLRYGSCLSFEVTIITRCKLTINTQNLTMTS